VSVLRVIDVSTRNTLPQVWQHHWLSVFSTTSSSDLGFALGRVDLWMSGVLSSELQKDSDG
jgi:hypothetical protein